MHVCRVLSRWLEERRPSLFHAVSNFNLPLKQTPGVPYVLTVHDLVPLLLPETVSTAFRWQFRLWLARSLEVAQQVIAVTDSSKFGRMCLHKIIDLDEVDVLITDTGAQESALQAIRKRDIEVIAV